MITTATPNLGAMPQQCLFPRRLRLIPPLETYPTVGKIGLWETLWGFSVCTFYSILLAIGWLREKLRPRYVYLDFSAFCTFSTMSIEPIRYPSIYDFSLIYLI
jgi:hypothetical protein